MMKSSIRSENGQALILLALAVVGLLGFSALAIDGGMIYSDRRIAQNASDASAVAGAGAAGETLLLNGVKYQDFESNCDLNSDISDAMSDAVEAAKSNAGSNDFPFDTADVEITTECVNNGAGPFNVGYIEVKVKITHPTQTAFAHFVYDGPVVNTVEAVTRVWPPFPEGIGLGIISLTSQCSGTDKGMFVNGTISVTVTGGGMWSNSCLQFKGSSGSVQADNGITYVMPDPDGFPATNMDVDPPPVWSSSPIEVSIEPPDCSGLTDHGKHNGGGTIQPGWYDEIKGKDELTMEPGIYCVNGVFSFNGDKLTGNDVTIVLTGDKGMSTAGSANVNLTAPKQSCISDYPSPGEICPPAVEGLLIYVTEPPPPPPTINKDVSLMGNSLSEFSGTVYNPYGYIEIGGNPDVTDPDCADPDSETCAIDYGVQLIGDTIKISGNVNVDINYDDDYIYLNPVQAEVSK